MQILIGLVLVGITLLCWLIYRYQQIEIRKRTQLLSESNKVITISKHITDRDGLGQVTGTFAGNDVSLKLELDTHTSRPEPLMWLHISLQRPANSTGSLDIVISPEPADRFSPGWQWPRPITPLKCWPQKARYMSRERPPVLQHIDTNIRSLFADQNIKALLILPETIRLTYLIKQAQTTFLSLLTNAKFDMTPVDSAEIAALIRQLQKLAFNLDGEVHQNEAA